MGNVIISPAAVAKITPTNTGTEGQILRNNGNGGCEWDNAATEQEIGTAVTNWLDINVPTGTTVVVDKTLSIENAAAEAETTGEEISTLKNIANANLNYTNTKARKTNNFNLVWTDDKSITSDGSVNDRVGISATLDYYPVWVGDIIRIRVFAPDPACVVAFYDREYVFDSYIVSQGNEDYIFEASEDGFLRFSNDFSEVSVPYAILTNSDSKSIEEIETDIITQGTALDARISGFENAFASMGLVIHDGRFYINPDGNVLPEQGGE